MRRSLLALAAAASLAGSTQAVAQDEGDVFAYVALISTPPAALAPMLTSAMVGGEQVGPKFGMRYGYIDVFGIGLHGVAATADLAVGKRGSNVGFQAGYQFVSCDAGEDCEGHFMLGGSFETRLARTAGTSPISVGLSTALGAGFPEGARLLTASVGVPLVLEASTSGGTRVAPFITPGLGYGHARIEDPFLGDMSESGVRFMLGGGVTVATARGISFGFGAQKVFIDQGDVQFGVGLSFGGRRTP